MEKQKLKASKAFTRESSCEPLWALAGGVTSWKEEIGGRHVSCTVPLLAALLLVPCFFPHHICERLARLEAWMS